MTYKELYNDVLCLGFEKTSGREDDFLICANRSLKQLFVDIRQEKTCTIPEGTMSIDLQTVAPDLLYFVDVRFRGVPIGDIARSGSQLTLPQDMGGPLTLHYHRTPASLTDDMSDDVAVDVPRSCEHLLSLLTASYLFLDDEPERSQYYLSLYRDGMLRLTSESKSRTHVYADVIGW